MLVHKAWTFGDLCFDFDRTLTKASANIFYLKLKGLVITILLPHVHSYAQICVRSTSVSRILRLCESCRSAGVFTLSCPLNTDGQWWEQLPKMVFNLHRELHDYRVVSNTCSWLWHPMQAVITLCLYTCVYGMAFQKLSGSTGLPFVSCVRLRVLIAPGTRLPTREALGAIGWGKDDPVQCLATARKCSVFSALFLLEQTLKAAPRLCPFLRWCPGSSGVLCRCARRGVFGPAACAGNRFVGAGTPPSAQRPGALSLGWGGRGAAMKGLSRLLRSGEDAAQGAVAGSHEGRESAGTHPNTLSTFTGARWGLETPNVWMRGWELGFGMWCSQGRVLQIARCPALT